MYIEIILLVLVILFLFLLLEIREMRKVLNNQNKIIQNGIIDQKENTEYYKDAIMKLLSEVSTFRKRLESNFEDKKEIEDEVLAEKVELLYDKALDIVEEEGKASATLLQRRLRIGYAMAASLIDMLEKNEIISPARGSKPREILLKSSESDHSNEDEKYLDVVEFTKDRGKISETILQRKFRIGYARAARLLDLMEEEKIIGSSNESRMREVLIDKNEE